ncbi:hypothetical protein NLG97_g4032 [Lecanicillium saksenae]|uniref:Uncharacterized protein n=1 Tax=Lecanicillium saksenae TaxID=468837 RepID=A0ACC1QWF4_9HYPO|nr:hypothetical protein NLG97_g4032 [Lecanicillium saksenae]
MSPGTVVAVPPSALDNDTEQGNKMHNENCTIQYDAESKAVTGARFLSDSPSTSLFSKLFCDEVILKIWKTAVEHLNREDPPQSFPETCPQTGPQAGQYLYRDAEFWTCGFFPGSLYCLLERSARYPQTFLAGEHGQAATREVLRSELLSVCRRWAEPLHDMSNRKDTHDIGFIVEPALRRDYELTGDMRSLRSIINAAESLASRYSETTKAIRSWDQFVNNGNNYVDKDSEFLVIIDSMCNLDLLYYAGHHASSRRLIDIATIHAHTIRQTHLRREPNVPGSKYPTFSTCHVANMCPKTGEILKRLTAQGFSDTSTWSRGQAWAILGFAQTYLWTKDEVFLQTACGLADYFIMRLISSPPCVEKVRNGVHAGRYVPLWDFDAPVNEESPLRDTSAAMIAANGMLLIANSCAASGDFEFFQKYYTAATSIVNETIALCFAEGKLDLVQKANGNGSCSVIARPAENGTVGTFECILKCATANFNGNWADKYADHGLVYADYYLLEFGNRLLQFGYV